MKIDRFRVSLLFGALFVAFAGIAFTGLRTSSPTGPVAAVKSGSRLAAPPPPGKQQAILAGGCFWSMEAIFKQLKGVEKAEPGYSGGRKPNPSYEQVENGDTGYAESLNIVFDPKTISYHDLLRVFFTVRDPTTLNRQGNDEGPQYRSTVFYQNAEQKRVAQEVMREVTKERIWKRPLVTELVPFSRFYRAEDYHMDYYRLHPDEPYCRYVIAPEIAQFRAKFKSRLKR
jgi:peptide-methionine (S)-S-oxide reductase